MKLRVRLWLPAAAMAAVTVASAALLAVGNHRREALDASVAAGQGRTDTVVRARLLVDGNVTRAVASVYSPGSELSTRLAPEAKRAAAELARIEPRLGELQTATAKQLVSAMSDVDAQVTAARRLKDEGDVGGAREIIDGPLQKAFAAFDSAAAKVLDETESARRDAQAQAARGRQVQLGFLGLAVVFLLGVTMASAALLARSICGPIERVQAFARRVAAGDLTQSPGIATNDEVGEAIAALDAMRLSLASTVGQVLDGAQSVQQASEQMSAASSDLSDRTERSAAALQSLRSLAAQLREQALAAREAGEHLLRNCGTAHDSNQAAARAVNEMIEIMQRIDRNARSVAESVQQVESIAFQTGILALNASIEAAHAGHRGRGFAVVAENVQTLARSSSGAAKDIQLLIEANLGSSQAGRQRVLESSGAMGHVASAFQALNSRVLEVSSALQAQRGSVERMSDELENVEHAVAQNAAMAEETAAAASHLRALADTMSRSVAHFRAGGEDGIPGIEAGAGDAETPLCLDPQPQPDEQR